MKKNHLGLWALYIPLMSGFLSCSQQKEVSLGDLNVIPAPYEVVEQNERAAFVIDNSTKIVYPEGNEKMKRNAEFLASYIRNLTGVEVGLSVGGDTGAIVLVLDDAVEGEEGYELNVSSERILLKGKTEAGVFYGIQTLHKAMPVTGGKTLAAIPCGTVKDHPRFELPRIYGRCRSPLFQHRLFEGNYRHAGSA